MVAAVIGVVAGLIHVGTVRIRSADLQQSFLAAFCGSLVAGVLMFVLPPVDAARALFSGVTLLVPAMVIVIGIEELASEAVESGLARLAYGLLRFLMIAFGITAALKLWSLVAPISERSAATPLPVPVVVLLLLAGGVALVPCLQGRRRDAPWIIGAVILAYATQELTELAFGSSGSPFVAAFVVGIAGLLLGRRRGSVPATVVVPGFLQLAPGFLGTEAVLALLGRSGGQDDQTFFQVFLVALQLVIGLLAAQLFRQPLLGTKG